MKQLLFVVLVACSSERAPVAPSTAVDAGTVETAAPVASTSSVSPDPDPIAPSLGPEIPRTLLQRLAREAAAIPNGQLRKSPPHDAERDRAIKAQFGDRCRLERTCGPLWGIDCEAAVDGPYIYVRPRADGWVRITTCGGACMGGRCTNCPPKNEGWTCETY